jgi:hypothetical protein
MPLGFRAILQLRGRQSAVGRTLRAKRQRVVPHWEPAGAGRQLRGARLHRVLRQYGLLAPGQRLL